MRIWPSLWNLPSTNLFSEIKKQIIPPQKINSSMALHPIQEHQNMGKIKLGGLVIAHPLFQKKITPSFFSQIDDLDEQITDALGLLGDFLMEVKFSTNDFSLSYSLRKLCENYFYQYLRQGEESFFYKNVILTRLVFLFHSAPTNATSLEILQKLSAELLPHPDLEQILQAAMPEIKNSGDVGASLWEAIFNYQNERMPEFYHPMFIEDIERGLLASPRDSRKWAEAEQEIQETLSEIANKLDEHENSLPLAFYWLRSDFFNRYARYGEGNEYYNNFVLARLVYFIATMDHSHPLDILRRLATELGGKTALSTIISKVEKRTKDNSDIGRLILETIGDYYQ